MKKTEVFTTLKDGTYKSPFRPKDSNFFSIAIFIPFEGFEEVHTEVRMNLTRTLFFCRIFGTTFMLFFKSS
jgi:hypothetical protein